MTQNLLAAEFGGEPTLVTTDADLELVDYNGCAARLRVHNLWRYAGEDRHGGSIINLGADQMERLNERGFAVSETAGHPGGKA